MHILCIVNVVVILSNVHKKGANHSRDEIKHIYYKCGKKETYYANVIGCKIFTITYAGFLHKNIYIHIKILYRLC